MSVLVIAEHDHGSLKAATLNTVTAATPMRRRSARAGRRPRRGKARRRPPARSPAWPRSCTPTTPPGRTAGRERRRAGAGHRQDLHATCCSRPPRTARTLPRAWPRCWMWRRSATSMKVDQRRHLRAPDLRRQRHCHRAVAVTRSRSSPCAPRPSTRPRQGGSAPVEKVDAVADSGTSRLRRRGDRQARPARTDGGQDHRLRRPRLGLERQVHPVLTPLADKLGAALGASRAAVDAGYAPERLAGRPDRQDRCAAAVHRRGHLRRDPAPGRDEGLQGHRRDQQGRGSPDLQVADYGLEADLFTAVPELTRSI